MNKRDHAALKLAVKMMRRDPARAKQLDDKLADGEPWEEVAEFASFHCQCRTLRLKPWETPPMLADEPYENSPGALALLQRMQAAGVSRWHPDPMKALAAAERAEAEADPQPAA